MPYIFRHHVRRWGVWGLGFALLVGVGCKSPTAGSSDAPKGWKMPGASLFHKKPAESSGSAEASASDSGSDAIPTAPPIPPGATAATSAAEARALLFGEKPGSGVVLTSAVESQPTVRGPNMSGVRVVPFGAKAALAHAQQPAAPATPAQPAAASSNSTAPAATPSAEETAFTELPPRRSAWVDPWASTETASGQAASDPNVGFGSDAAAAPAGAELIAGSPGSSRRPREGEGQWGVDPQALAASNPTLHAGADSQRVYAWKVAPANERLEPAAVDAPMQPGSPSEPALPPRVVERTPPAVPMLTANPLLAMALGNTRPRYQAPDEPAPITAPPAYVATPAYTAPSAPTVPVAPTSDASLLLTAKSAALLRPDGCTPAAPAVSAQPAISGQQAVASAGVAPAPADVVTELVAKSQRKLDQVRNYEARMTWKHTGVAEPAPKEGHAVQISCRTQPRAISADFSPSAASKKWLYTEENGEPSLTQCQATSLGRVLMDVDPTDSQARAAHRRPISEWGLESLLDEIAQAVELRDAGAAQIKYAGRIYREDCKAELEQLVVTFPGRPGRIEYYFDAQSSLPVMVVSCDSAGKVREYERYANLKVNVGALDAPMAFNADAVLRR